MCVILASIDLIEFERALVIAFYEPITGFGGALYIYRIIRDFKLYMNLS